MYAFTFFFFSKSNLSLPPQCLDSAWYVASTIYPVQKFTTNRNKCFYYITGSTYIKPPLKGGKIISSYCNLTAQTITNPPPNQSQS